MSRCPTFLFADFGDRADAPAFIDGSSGTEITFGELSDMVDKIAAALAERGIGAGDVVGAVRAQLAGVGRGLPRRPARQRHRHQRELALHRRASWPTSSPTPAPKLLVTVSPFLDRARRGAAEAGLRRRRGHHARRRSRASPRCADLLATDGQPPAAHRRRRATPRCCPTPRAPPGGPRA